MNTTKPDTDTPKLYGERDPIKQGEYYFRHMNAMTAEGLHSKSAIAEELAHRDMEIDRLRALPAQHPASVPGWRLVPVQATAAMMQSVAGGNRMETARQWYAAMLAAAPQPPPTSAASAVGERSPVPDLDALIADTPARNERLRKAARLDRDAYHWPAAEMQDYLRRLVMTVRKAGPNWDETSNDEYADKLIAEAGTPPAAPIPDKGEAVAWIAEDSVPGEMPSVWFAESLASDFCKNKPGRHYYPVYTTPQPKSVEVMEQELRNAVLAAQRVSATPRPGIIGELQELAEKVSNRAAQSHSDGYTDQAYAQGRIADELRALIHSMARATKEGGL